MYNTEPYGFKINGEKMFSVSNKVQFVPLTKLSYNLTKFIVHSKGDMKSFVDLKESIQSNGILVPVVVNSDFKVIDGHRRIHILKELQIDEVPILIITNELSSEKIQQLQIELLLSNRNLTHLDLIQIYFQQNKTLSQYKNSFSKYMAEKLNVSQRSIQIKIKCGEMFFKLPAELKETFRDINSRKKIPLVVFKNMIDLDKVELREFINEIKKQNEFSTEVLEALSKKFKKKHDRNIRDMKIQQEMTKNEETLNTIITENLIEISSTNIQDEKKQIINDMKTLYIIFLKKYFIGIDSDEEKEFTSLYHQYNIDFSQETKLIQSILGEEK